MTISSSTAYSLLGPAVHQAKVLEAGRPAVWPPDKDAPGAKRPRGLICETTDQGRFILQVVGTIVFCVSILDTRCQPQPVFSSSNGSLVLSARVPKEEM